MRLERHKGLRGWLSRAALLTSAVLCSAAPLPSSASASASAAPSAEGKRLADARRAIVELDVDRAATLLEGARGQDATYLRALLAVYRGDCDGAAALLASPVLKNREDGVHLSELARRCAGATAGGVVVEDREQGVWIRLQDEADRVLVPLLVASASRARDAVERHLGVDLPRPLRMDLVRDLFSLSAVSGLPLPAAETTGTVAVARWGRITMISPRATLRGYPWQDTLAHEITHLVLSRASADHAPLWLQEGIAKREETRWRAPRPFDETPDPNRVAWQALRQGKSVGVDQLGPSIAMLPTPEAASIAFAEVSSFMGYWVEQNGTPALTLLLADLKVAKDADQAMRSVSGYGLSDWKLRWQEHLATTQKSEPATPDGSFDEVEALLPGVAHGGRPTLSPRELARLLRLGELLSNADEHGAALALIEPQLPQAPMVAPLRWEGARAAWLAGGSNAPELLGTLRDIDGVHGGWMALRGRWTSAGAAPDAAKKESPKPATDDAAGPRSAEELWEHALAVDPLSVDVACEGYPKQMPLPHREPPLPEDPARRALCEHVRRLPTRGSE